MNGLREYQIRILKQDMGNMFIPMFFYHQETEGKVETNIRYDFSDHWSLQEWLAHNDYNLLELLDVLENIALLLDKCKEVLINYENLTIGIDTIFVSTIHNNEIKLQYIPRGELDDRFSFYQLLKEIGIYVTENRMQEYMKILLGKQEQERPNLQKTINMLGRLKREIYICGWI